MIKAYVDGFAAYKNRMHGGGGDSEKEADSLDSVEYPAEDDQAYLREWIKNSHGQ